MRRTGYCRPCDKPVSKASTAASPLAATVATSAESASKKILGRSVSLDSEGVVLWRHVLYGLGTIVGLLEGYTDIGVPGNPLTELEALLRRIHTLVNRHRDTAKHVDRPTQVQLPADQDRNRDQEPSKDSDMR
jgi:hypothetical protein